MLGIGEEIQVLQVLADARGDYAVVEPDGDEVDIVERRRAGAIEGVAHLTLEVAAFGDGGGGEAGDEEIGRVDGALDGAGPVLAGQEFAAVHPGVESSVFEKSVELIDGSGVLFDVGEEDGGTAVWNELDAATARGLKGPDALDFDAVAAGEAAFHKLGDLCGAGLFIGRHGGCLSRGSPFQTGRMEWGQARSGQGLGEPRAHLCEAA